VGLARRRRIETPGPEAALGTLARVRVLVVDTYYPAFLEAHYAQRPGLGGKSYDAQLEALMYRSFGTSDAYSHHLRELGHEATELVVNCLPLQQRWAREHGRVGIAGRLTELPGRAGAAVRYRFLHEVARAQVATFDPHVVYVQDLWFFRRDELDRMRGEGRLVVGQIASQPPGADIVRGFDLITTSFPHYVERFRAAGVGSEYFPIAFDERVLERLRANGVDPDPRSHREVGVAFVGGLNAGVHPAGVALVERLARRLPLEAWGYGGDVLPADSPLRARYRGEAWGLDMYGALARARISLNRHIEAAEGFANNMRIFESTGVGSLLVTESAPNLGDLFEPGREVVAYDDEEDLVARVEHYLTHDDERREVAAAGQERTLREHTYGRRIAELADMLQARLS
jgi:spore maturation protein CgeB